MVLHAAVDAVPKKDEGWLEVKAEVVLAVGAPNPVDEAPSPTTAVVVGAVVAAVPNSPADDTVMPTVESELVVVEGAPNSPTDGAELVMAPKIETPPPMFGELNSGFDAPNKPDDVVDE